jgi:hypothetical protein
MRLDEVATSKPKEREPRAAAPGETATGIATETSAMADALARALKR